MKMCSQAIERTAGPADKSYEDVPEPWILNSLFVGPDQRFQRIGSLLLGLVGPLLFAIASCAVSGFAVASMEFFGSRESFARATASLVAFLLGSGSYFAVMIVLHLYASCQFPLSVRLSMIYAAIFLCWTAAAFPFGETIGPAVVLTSLPLCLGGFFLRWFRGWRAQSWGQSLDKQRLTIFNLLDMTTAIAITLGLYSMEPSRVEPNGMLCLVPTFFAFAAFGLHVWARLLTICPTRHHAGSGFGIWMAVNTLWAFLVFISFAVGFSSSPLGLLGFLAAPLAILVAHLWTEIPLRWLRACGWTMVRIDDGNADVKNHRPERIEDILNVV